MHADLVRLIDECELPDQKGKTVLYLEHAGNFDAAFAHFERLTEDQAWHGLVNQNAGKPAPGNHAGNLWLVNAKFKGDPSGTVALRKFSGTPPHYPGIDLDNIPGLQEWAAAKWGEKVKGFSGNKKNKVAIKFRQYAGGFAGV